MPSLPKPNDEEIRRVKIDRSGRFILPSAIRKELGLLEGDILLVTANDRHLTYRRWEGTEAELEAMERADQIAQIIEGSDPTVRGILDETIKKRYTITADHLGSDDD